MTINTQQVLCNIPINTSVIPQARLNIESKERTNPFAWKGQFSPQLVETLLEHFAAANEVVLDPFAGSGTVLYEAGRRSLQCFGSEINPAAFLMASTYQLINSSPLERHQSASIVESTLHEAISTSLPLFSMSRVTEQDLKSQLKSLLAEIVDPIARDLLRTLIVRLDFFQPGLTEERVFSTWKKLRSFIESLPHSRNLIRVFNADARAIPIGEAQVDLVITSPPYINVYNYHQQYRASTEALGWNLLRVAKSEIGSNRKHRGNRLLTVIQYCLDLTQTLLELVRVTKPSARLVFVVGRESAVRKTRFLNGEIVARLAVQAVGLKLKMRQERVFMNRFGTNIFEDILHFAEPASSSTDPMVIARRIAKEILEEASSFAPAEVGPDLEDALHTLEAIEPSPFYRVPSHSPSLTQEVSP